MKYLFTIALTLVLAISAFAQQAETLQVDITKLSQQELLVYQQLKQKQAAATFDVKNLTPDTISKYAEVGKAFGSAFKECWTTVSTDAEKFANSDAGKLTMVLIAWKIVGQDGINLVEKAVQYIIGIPLFFLGTFTFIWVFRRNCMTRPQLVSATKVGWLTVKREYKGTTEALWGGEAAVVVGVCYAIFVGICSLIVFVG